MESEEAIGLDLGGTKLATGVVDGEGRVLWSDEVPSSGYSHEGVIDLLSEAILRARKARPGAAVAGVGIPARVEQRTGRAVGTVNLDLEDVAVSAGAACSSGKVAASHVLAAVGADDALARSAIRVSMGGLTGAAEVDRFVEVWQALYRRCGGRRNAA